MTTISVTELVQNFAEACRVLVPMLDRVLVPWSDEEKYDNWDRISEPLFISLVTEPCAYHVGNWGKLKVAGYDFDGVDPGTNAYVAVAGPELHRLIGLSSSAAPFDQARAAGTEHNILLSLADAEFVFVVEGPSGKQIIEVVDLEVE